MKKYELIIQKGRIIDGTGNPYYVADIAVKDGKIIRIHKALEPSDARHVISAEGLAVSPGFFDTHSHDDLYLLTHPACSEKIAQGVTTVVIGNCGFSVTPISEDHRSEIEDAFKVMGGEHVSKEKLRLNAFSDYLESLNGSNIGINVIPLVGHSTVRTAVMGSTDRTPTRAEMKQMKVAIADAMTQGAFGLSTGLIYAPGSYAETDEIISLCKTVAENNGIYTSHIRSEGDALIPAVAEAIHIGKKAGIPVHISHHKAMGRNNWGKSAETLKMIEQARLEGIEVTCDQYPYTAASTFLAAAIPPRFLAGGPEKLSRTLKDAKTREAVRQEIETGGDNGWENLIGAAGFDAIVITSSSNHLQYTGKSIADVALMENKDPYDVIFDLVSEETRGIVVVLFLMDDPDLENIMRAPFTMVGTDGVPAFGANKTHPRLTGTFPRVLGRYVRERKILTLEEAVRKMTSLPVQTFGVWEKGLLKEGFDADMVVFDPENITDRSTYEEPFRKPEGIHWVLVNGVIAVENGEIVESGSGEVLRPVSNR